MLTQDQKDQLTNLMTECDIPILKDILAEALPKFISDEVKPIQHQLGVFVVNGKYQPTARNACCLIGASFVGKPENAILKYYDGIEYSMREEISSAFDDVPIDRNTEISEYVSKIRKVIFGC